MPEFTLDEWIIILLVFILGLLLGMFAFAGDKWKRRYREEKRLRAGERDELDEERRLREEIERDRDEWRARAERAEAAPPAPPPPPRALPRPYPSLSP
ncbi:MAG: hypothetical protein ACFBQW_03305, partial [Sphingomonadaceae bacterium]